MHSPPAEPTPSSTEADLSDRGAPSELLAQPQRSLIRDLHRVWMGEQGLRTGWSVTIFLLFVAGFLLLLSLIEAALTTASDHPQSASMLTPQSAFIQELVQLLSLLGALALTARMEGRRILDYNLADRRSLPHFLSGLAAGVAGLSLLVAGLAWGGWLHIASNSLSGPRILAYAVAWGAVFLCTSFFEEGAFRCYLQSTLTRGINFWWALALVSSLSTVALLTSPAQGARGICLFALLGLPLSLWLHFTKKPHAAFWFAAWATSTFFGFIHLSNGGENGIGIFAASAIGLVFCVSVRLTGSAWWALGCHAAWDWAETYLYGAADSGMLARGHLLTSTPLGNPLWSGGSDGPEGSLLVLGVILLLLLALVAIHGRENSPLKHRAG